MTFALDWKPGGVPMAAPPPPLPEGEPELAQQAPVVQPEHTQEGPLLAPETLHLVAPRSPGQPPPPKTDQGALAGRFLDWKAGAPTPIEQPAAPVPPAAAPPEPAPEPAKEDLPQPPQPRTGAAAKFHPYETKVRELAAAANSDPNFVALAVGVLKSESSAGNPNKPGPKTRSGEQARGPMQVMPGTFGQYRPKNGVISNPDHVVAAGVNYLAYLWNKYDGDPEKTAAAYNFGDGNIDKGRPLPPETQAYVPTVMGHMRAALEQPVPSSRFKLAGPPVPIEQAAPAAAAPATPAASPPAQAAPLPLPSAQRDPATIQKNQAIVQQMLNDQLTPFGVGEATLEAMTDFFASAPAAVAGMSVAIAQKDPQAYAQAFNEAKQNWVQHPHTAQGKYAAAQAQKVLSLFGKLGEFLNGLNQTSVTEPETGRELNAETPEYRAPDPLTAAIIQTLTQGAPLLAGLRGGKPGVPETVVRPQGVEPWQRLEPAMQGAGPSPAQVYGGARIEPTADPARVPDAALGTEPSITAPRAPEPATPAPGALPQPADEVSISVPQQGRVQIDEVNGEPRGTALLDEEPQAAQATPAPEVEKPPAQSQSAPVHPLITEIDSTIEGGLSRQRYLSAQKKIRAEAKKAANAEDDDLLDALMQAKHRLDDAWNAVNTDKPTTRTYNPNTDKFE